MNLRFLCALPTAWLVFLALASEARAQEEGPPLLVDYSAPAADCASSDAFQTRLRAETARSPDIAHPRRFAVQIRRIPDGRYEGTLTAGTAVRQVTASRCGEVTDSLATIIAIAEPPADIPDAPASAPAAPPPPAVATPRSDPRDRATDAADHASPTTWRVGARGFATNHPSWGTPNPGVLGFASIEVPWGFHAMLFEAGFGAFFAHGSTPQALVPTPTPTWVDSRVTFLIFDTQACLLDLAIARSGVSVLGCLRGTGGYFSGSGGAIYPMQGLAAWGGAGARLRWQSPIRLFFEVNVDAMIGTISDAVDDRPWWFDGGASVGFQI